MLGIICIETEWQITKRGNRRPVNSEPLMEFIGTMYNVPYIYRRVATRGELVYYLEQFKKHEYDKYDVFYFSFHGGTHSISLEGDKENISLDDLSEMGGTVFQGRYIHFSSCRTFLGSAEVNENFKKQSHAKFVSGYTKSVDDDLSAIHDIALLGIYFRAKNKSTSFKKMDEYFHGLESKLGFNHE